MESGQNPRKKERGCCNITYEISFIRINRLSRERNLIGSIQYSNTKMNATKQKNNTITCLQNGIDLIKYIKQYHKPSNQTRKTAI